MKALLEYAASLLIAEKDKLAVKEQNDMTGRLEKCIISVAPGDIKLIIGREGRTIKALRSLVCIAAANKGIKKRIPLEIINE